MTELIASLGIGSITIIAAIGIFLRRWSRDKLEIAKDRAEEDLIRHLIKQRDDAREELKVLKEHIEVIAGEGDQDMEKIRQMTAREQQLLAQNSMLKNLVDRLAGALDESKARLIELMREVTSPPANTPD